jgi:high-affinity nickel-transport protein
MECAPVRGGLPSSQCTTGLYPLGLLFGLGFDTASTVLLLAVSGIASAKTRRPADLVLLPLGFTAAMTAIDCLDGIVMAWAYAPSNHHKTWKLYDRKAVVVAEEVIERKEFITNRVSLVLTVASIILAFCVALIEFMGLASSQLNGGQRPGLRARVRWFSHGS